jgi:hypothetical protein
MASIVENRLVWPRSCNRCRLDDELRGSADALLTAALTGVATQILVEPSMLFPDSFPESSPLAFVDQARKMQIRERQIDPMLEAVFMPRGRSPLEHPTDVDESGRLILIWGDLVDFLETLVLSSELRLPFVFDLERLAKDLRRIRNHLMRQGALEDPRPLSDLVAMLSLWKPVDASCLFPSSAVRGNPLEIWDGLRANPEYRRLSHETRRLGAVRADSLRDALRALRVRAERVASNPILAGVTSVAKSAVGLFLGPPYQLASEVVSKTAPGIFRKRYIPPVYSLTAIEAVFDEIFYPERGE